MLILLCVATAARVLRLKERGLMHLLVDLKKFLLADSAPDPDDVLTDCFTLCRSIADNLGVDPAEPGRLAPAIAAICTGQPSLKESSAEDAAVLFRVAALAGDLAALEALQLSFPFTKCCSADSLHKTFFLAVLAGHLPALAWLSLQSPRSLCHSELLHCAIGCGHVHMLKWLGCVAADDLHGSEANRLSFFLGRAALRGHFDSVKWLASFRPAIFKNCSAASWLACRGGHIDVLMFLHGFLRVDLGCIPIAAKYGYSLILEWLLSVCRRADISDAVVNAIRGGHVEALRTILRCQYLSPAVATVGFLTACQAPVQPDCAHMLARYAEKPYVFASGNAVAVKLWNIFTLEYLVLAERRASRAAPRRPRLPPELWELVAEFVGLTN